MHTAMYLLFLLKQILEVFRHQYTRGFFFLFVCALCSISWIYYNLFNAAGGHFGCFHYFAFETMLHQSPL